MYLTTILRDSDSVGLWGGSCIHIGIDLSKVILMCILGKACQIKTINVLLSSKLIWTITRHTERRFRPNIFLKWSLKTNWKSLYEICQNFKRVTFKVFKIVPWMPCECSKIFQIRSSSVIESLKGKSLYNLNVFLWISRLSQDGGVTGCYGSVQKNELLWRFLRI